MDNQKKGLELNKVHKWEDIVKAYPDMHAFITDVKMADGEIKTCKLLNVCTFDNIHLYIKKYREKRIHFECHRTTDKMPDLGAMF